MVSPFMRNDSHSHEGRHARRSAGHGVPHASVVGERRHVCPLAAGDSAGSDCGPSAAAAGAAGGRCSALPTARRMPPLERDRLVAFPVSTLVNLPANDDPRCVEPLDPAEEPQGTLPLF